MCDSKERRGSLLLSSGWQLAPLWQMLWRIGRNFMAVSPLSSGSKSHLQPQAWQRQVWFSGTEEGNQKVRISQGLQSL